MNNADWIKCTKNYGLFYIDKELKNNDDDEKLFINQKFMFDEVT